MKSGFEYFEKVTMLNIDTNMKEFTEEMYIT
jgi:hypothetical protein